MLPRRHGPRCLRCRLLHQRLPRSCYLHLNYQHQHHLQHYFHHTHHRDLRQGDLRHPYSYQLHSHHLSYHLLLLDQGQAFTIHHWCCHHHRHQPRHCSPYQDRQRCWLYRCQCFGSLGCWSRCSLLSKVLRKKDFREADGFGLDDYLGNRRD